MNRIDDDLDTDTVEPDQYGHQGDTAMCPYYPGVRIKRALQKNFPDTFYRYKD